MNTQVKKLNLIDIKKQFSSSSLLPILIRIFVATSSLRKKAVIRLSQQEITLLKEAGQNGKFEPSWALMTCFGTLFPETEIFRSVDKFKQATGLVISVIENKYLTEIKINTC